MLDVAGPAERTGKARGTDLLDGTVTLPLILARERDPALAELDLRALDADGRRGASATGSPPPACSRRSARDARARVEAAKAALDAAPLDEQRRELLTLVADGVVERYS